MSEGWTSPFEARKQDSHEVQQREVQNPVPGKEKTQATLQAGDQPAEKQLYRKRPGSPSRYKIEHQPTLHTCSRRGPAASEAALEEALPADWTPSSFPFIENWWDTQSAGSNSGLPTARQTRSYWSESSKGARTQREIEEIPYKYRENFYCEDAETGGACPWETCPNCPWTEQVVGLCDCQEVFSSSLSDSIIPWNNPLIDHRSNSNLAESYSIQLVSRPRRQTYSVSLPKEYIRLVFQV